MVKLKGHEWDSIKDWFCPNPGIVLDFSNRTFANFFEEEFDNNIYADAFSERGSSKFSRLQAFIDVSPAYTVTEVLQKLWVRRNLERDANIEALEANWRSDYYNPKYIAELKSQAEAENKPFVLLIKALELRNGDISIGTLRERTSDWTLDTVNRDIERAIKSLESDPEAAITAASSMLESLLRSVIIARGLPLPRSMDIQSLYKEARGPPGLSPDIEVKNSEIEADVRTILAGIGNVIAGIGALRTHVGSAHGRERGYRRADERIARLAVNSACGICLFIVETWEKRFPQDQLIASENQ